MLNQFLSRNGMQTLKKICFILTLFFPIFAMQGNAFAEQKLPLPRMVSLRAEEVNIRSGPGLQHPIKWIFKVKSMPVEIIAEFETWRKIRDYQGDIGWVHRAMLTSKRSVVTIESQTTILKRPTKDAQPVAKMAKGFVAVVDKCNESWCFVQAQGYEGWVARTDVWGIYPHEVIN